MIEAYGGIARVVPMFAALLTLVSLSSIGLPGTNGFVGEFLVLLGAFESELRWYAIIATSGVILSAVYMLWMFQRVMFGELSNPKNQTLKDLNAREITIMVPLIALIFILGIYPKPIIDSMAPSIDRLIAQTKVVKQVAQVAPAEAAALPAGMPAGHPPIGAEAAPAAAPAEAAPAGMPAGHPPIGAAPAAAPAGLPAGHPPIDGK